MEDLDQMKLEADEVRGKIGQQAQELVRLTDNGITDIDEVKLLTEQVAANAERLLKLTEAIRDLEQPELR